MHQKNRKSTIRKSLGAVFAAAIIFISVPMTASAHCDTMDGPTVADGYKALESNNVNYVLKWVQPEYEKEITDIFNLSMKVKDLSPEAKELSEKYFFENLVRLHRAGEGAPYEGLKPSGVPIDEKVLAADKSIELGNLSPFDGLIEEEQIPELTERFEAVMALKDYDVNDVEAGREYIEAYVKFFKFAEGEEEGEHGTEESNVTEDAPAIENNHVDEAQNDKQETKTTTVKKTTYTVKSGDTLWDIAIKYHTTWQKIQKANNISNPDLIYPDQVFVIPTK